MSLEKIILAKPRGFCAGVERAIEIVEQALQHVEGPIYVRKEIVHNPHVVTGLRAKGAVFVEALEEVPQGRLAIFSAHGVSPAVHQQAARRTLRVIDATCPLVTKVHVEAKRYAREGYTILLVGHEGHDEVIGTMGEAPASIRLIQTTQDAERVQVPDSQKVAAITQTTLSLDDTRAIIDVLTRRFPTLVSPSKDDICYATQNRQNAVKAIAKEAEAILVIGAKNSSNSIRLVEVAQGAGRRGHLINQANEIDPRWFEGVRCVGVTSGASAPEHLVQEVVASLQRLGATRVEEWELVKEDVNFGLPLELTQLEAGSRKAEA
ncbi:MAG TPA: 4-hydroxy-3-methylbut-2-enyl diphosphate reductase [Candidatus Omnitrophica bacterium]|nr:MAG: 4-hydroxy-3-methylbut-2-enyl diphosphate reductase [Omnitrophica WOR_2 bacterium GWA2_63_20]OGX18737.1 MAG: 4-hydroxy-3-methylbut-2-enyl diphosphate reductase [Omnitrophica WOR_2 bacterium GWF2_63_9]OGX30881.1 MAG: 4-hydroxy-3-methylbut-2-enyl diphosphate reductase [Omnitrophica WOR_2 bacterium RIFCSPHIGHO2_12_FULL_64_13]OGX36511.1 MAG: 4-hydroxy-3-methylbut-2-enyl diphosphate reductase [Omnitrophica WOR_2 bacterium RIFCSPHIGHO2_02_FULL_63_39]OGX46275.1 MAG: 4-hydroxy-3-methylbut-2-enyl